jgi:hypothetical protein
MKNGRHLAVQALNEYRRRDIATYLSTRYYLNALCAQSNHWAETVCVDSVLQRLNGQYVQSFHFKEIEDDGHIVTRPIQMPAGSEALAEAVLMSEMGLKQPNDAASRCVYSYKLSAHRDPSGFFENYMTGLRRRQTAIKEACEAHGPGSIVLYADIRNFYPSIPHTLADEAWRRTSSEFDIGPRLSALGAKLLNDYRRSAETEKTGLPVGPAFAHVVANAVLRPIDIAFSDSSAVRYFRYVDDIVLVGAPDRVHETRQMIADRLLAMGLRLHDRTSPKTIEVPSLRWLEAASDFHPPAEAESWPGLIVRIKRVLLFHPEKISDLSTRLSLAGFRLPIRDYTTSVHETAFLDRLRTWVSRRWWRLVGQDATVDRIVMLATRLRERYLGQLIGLAVRTSTAVGFERKRLIPRLRYLSGRMVYLADTEQLKVCGNALQDIPELIIHREVMSAAVTSDVTRVVELGSNAAQAAAQVLRSAGLINVVCRDIVDGQDQTDGSLAVLHFNGLRVRRSPGQPSRRAPLLVFAMDGSNRELMRSTDLFVRDVACLRGINHPQSHADLIDTAFDSDEVYALDAVDQLQHSGSL